MGLPKCTSSCQDTILLYSSRNIIYLGGSNKITDQFLNAYIPNIFRRCWQVDNLTFPCGCPFQSFSTGILDPLNYYDPKLLSDINIKSLFYFGISAQNSNINNIKYKLTFAQIKKYINPNFQNEADYTNFTSYFNRRFNYNSLIYQFYNLYISAIYLTYTSNIETCNFPIQWDYVFACTIYKVKEAYIYPGYFTPSQLKLIYQTYLAYFINITTNTVNQNSSAYTKLNSYFRYSFKFLRLIYIFIGVFQDIQIQYFYAIRKQRYCLKPYMRKSQFIKVNKLYAKYRANKVYVNNNPYNPDS
jgi:hypothetical protein